MRRIHILPRADADLKAVGGIEPLIAALNSSNADIRAAAADVLGTAASNNISAQQDVVDICPEILQKLLQVSQHCRDNSHLIIHSVKTRIFHGPQCHYRLMQAYCELLRFAGDADQPHADSHQGAVCSWQVPAKQCPATAELL
jgi:hypothetical protein